MGATLRHEVAAAGLLANPWTDDPVTEADLAVLPEAAQRYLHFFVTPDRWFAPPGAREPVRTPWSTPVDGWQACGDRMLPTGVRAVWLREEGRFTYAEGTVSCEDVASNVPPDEI